MTDHENLFWPMVVYRYLFLVASFRILSLRQPRFGFYSTINDLQQLTRNVSSRRKSIRSVAGGTTYAYPMSLNTNQVLIVEILQFIMLRRREKKTYQWTQFDKVRIQDTSAKSNSLSLHSFQLLILSEFDWNTKGDKRGK